MGCPIGGKHVFNQNVSYSSPIHVYGIDLDSNEQL
jgi:hypothetical protein